MKIATMLLAVLLWAAAPGIATGGATGVVDELVPGDTAVVKRVVDGDTVVLEQAIDGATQVRLVGIQAPKLPLGRTGFRAWPLSAESKAALEALALGRKVELRYGGRRMDRHGRLLAHLYMAARDGSNQTDGGGWVQGALIDQGMARVYSFPDNRSHVVEMLARERAARTARRGIWGHPYYALRPVDGAGSLGSLGGTGTPIGTFQIVEGTVLAAARVKGRVYLNFGPDWHTDFTVSLDSQARRLFRKMNIDPLDFEGRRLRVRGWIRRYNGPLIEATHPEQIELLAE